MRKTSQVNAITVAHSAKMSRLFGSAVDWTMISEATGSPLRRVLIFRSWQTNQVYDHYCAGCDWFSFRGPICSTRILRTGHKCTYLSELENYNVVHARDGQ